MSDFEILESLLKPQGSNVNLYFNPPPSASMRYPAIRCQLKSIDNQHANDDIYGQKRAYQVIVICKELGGELIDRISRLKYCKFDRHYVADNLNHYVFTIYI